MHLKILSIPTIICIKTMPLTIQILDTHFQSWGHPCSKTHYLWVLLRPTPPYRDTKDPFFFQLTYLPALAQLNRLIHYLERKLYLRPRRPEPHISCLILKSQTHAWLISLHGLKAQLRLRQLPGLLGFC